MVVTRIGPVSCAKITGTLYGIIGVVVGAFVSLIAMAGGFGANSESAAGIGAIMGVGAIVVFPIFYGALGFIGTLVIVWLYNVLAGMVGGIEIDLK